MIISARAEPILNWFAPRTTAIQVPRAGNPPAWSTACAPTVSRQLMKTEFNAFVWWDLRNGTDTTGDFDPVLYGWRSYGDLGIINGLITKHPTFYAAKLMRQFVQDGGQVLTASSVAAAFGLFDARWRALLLLVLHKTLPQILTRKSR